MKHREMFLCIVHKFLGITYKDNWIFLYININLIIKREFVAFAGFDHEVDDVVDQRGR